MILEGAYRLTVFQRRSNDPYESTPLVPTGSGAAIHTDPFQVASIQNLSGWKPYLNGTPQGQPGNVVFPDVSVSVGTYIVNLLDNRVNSGNLQRWVSAFLADENRQPRLLGRRAVLEESLDGGNTWNGVFAGRITDLQLTDPLTLQFTISDQSADLKTPIFDYIPNVSYANFQSVLPVGMNANMPYGVSDTNAIVLNAGYMYGTYNSNYFSSSLESEGYYGVTFTIGFPPGNPNANRTLPYNVITPNLISAANNLVNITPNNLNLYANGPGQVAITSSTNGHAGRVGLVQIDADSTTSVCTGFLFEMLPATNIYAGNLTLTDIKAAAQLNCRLLLYNQSAAGTRDPMYLSAHPVQILKDICDGMFSRPDANGNPTKIFSYDSQSMGYLINGKYDSFGNLEYGGPAIYGGGSVLPTFKISQEYTAADFIQNCICKPYSLSYAMSTLPSASTYVSALVPYLTTLPTTTLLPSMSVDDVAVSTAPTWELVAPINVTSITYYIDTPNTDVPIAGKQWSATIENSEIYETVNLKDPDADSSTSAFTIDQAVGVRAMTTLTNFNFYENSNIPTSVAIPGSPISAVNQIAQGLVNVYSGRFQGGDSLIVLECRRTPTVNALGIGNWVIVDVDMLPNAAFSVRGGPRLMQVTSNAFQGGTTILSLTDGGASGSMDTPVINAFTGGSNSVQITITTDQLARIVMEYAAMPLGGSQPSSGDSGWIFGNVVTATLNSSSFTLPNIPSSTTVFARIQAQSPAFEDALLPSPWVYSSGVNLAADPPPTSVYVDTISTKDAKVHWTPANGYLATQISLASPQNSTFNPLVVLIPGSTIYTLTGLDLLTSPSCSVGVRHVDSNNGMSLMVSASFIATGSAPQLSDLGDIFILYGDT